DFLTPAGALGSSTIMVVCYAATSKRIVALQSHSPRMVYQRSRRRRPRRRQWNPHSYFGSCGLPHIPLAHAKSAAALDQIDVNMGLMMTVGTRPQYCREPMACAIAQVFAKVLG